MNKLAAAIQLGVIQSSALVGAVKSKVIGILKWVKG